MCFVKKILALVVLAGFLVLGVVGCGSPSTPAKPASSPTTGPAKDKPQQ
jgi:hypothetical protein